MGMGKRVSAIGPRRMLQLLPSPWHDCFGKLLDQATASLVLCSPYIGNDPCARVRDRIRTWPFDFHFLLLTDLSRDNMLSGATDVIAILSLVNAFGNADVRFLPSLHAKVYVADETEAVVTSANMTAAGLVRNFEYGVRFTDPATVRVIRRDVLRYASLASRIDKEQLGKFAAITEELKAMRLRVERSTKSRFRREFAKRLQEADEQVVRVRAGGRAPHTIFAEAITHILETAPVRTPDLHRAIQRIHPDLCDDSVDRVIDGHHFGKKWKHAVRTAQQHLKKRGEIELAGGFWRMR